MSQPSPDVNEPKYDVEVYIGRGANLYASSYLFTAVLDAEHAGHIRIDWKKSTYQGSGVLMVVRRSGTKASRKIWFGVHDRSYRFAPEMLSSCDCYFKRSYYEPDVAKLPERERIRPFGPIFGMRSPVNRVSFLMRVRKYRLPLARMFTAEGKEILRDMYNYYTFPALTDIERADTVKAEPLVLYATRLWEKHDVTAPPYCDEINEGRIALVRALKKNFGARFRGGLADVAGARQICPDLITPFPTNRGYYFSEARKCLIGVYSKGLHHSTAWKAGEYLAASLCIVAEPFRNQDRAPWRSPENYLTFATADECVARCAYLLDNPAAAQQMRTNNFRLYIEHVRPAASLLRSFEEAFSIPPRQEAGS